MSTGGQRNGSGEDSAAAFVVSWGEAAARGVVAWAFRGVGASGAEQLRFTKGLIPGAILQEILYVYPGLNELSYFCDTSWRKNNQDCRLIAVL